MAKHTEAIRRSILNLNPFVFDQLLFQVALWRFEQKLPEKLIAKKLVSWVKINLPTAYNKNGSFSGSTVRNYINKAFKRGFVRVDRFPDQSIVNKIQNQLKLSPGRPLITVAPDRSEMLRYAWLDLVDLLIRLIKTEKQENVIVGVSGGHTMLDFAKKASSVADLRWHQEEGISDIVKKKVTVCSLTSGGIRSDIAALSDTVAAIISDFLKSNASGLLGPAWFADGDALSVFSRDPDVKKHIGLVENAKIILTSVGFIDDKKSLMRELIDKSEESEFIKNNPHTADILYNCYNGLSGEPVNLPDKVRNGLFSVINIEQLKQKVQNGTYCFVMASGYEKGAFSMKPILTNQLASHVYIDKSCSEGILLGKE